MTHGVAPTTELRRTGPNGPVLRAFVGSCSGGSSSVLLVTMAWGIHGLVAKPGLNTADPQSWLPKQQLDHPVDQTVVGHGGPPGAHRGRWRRPGDDTGLFGAGGRQRPGGARRRAPRPCRRFTTCTWTISLSHVIGTVPISVADFDSIDHTQTVYKPTLVPGQPALPTTLHAGEKPSSRSAR